MPSVAITAAAVDGPAPPGLSVELYRDPVDLLDTIADTRDKPCDSGPPEAFFPVGTQMNTNRAREVCTDTITGARCAAAASCLAYALKTHQVGDDSGVWGGTTPRERTKLRRSL